MAPPAIISLTRIAILTTAPKFTTKLQLQFISRLLSSSSLPLSGSSVMRLYNRKYLRFVNETDLDCPPLILENGHRLAHTPEAELLIEAFLSRSRVQNDLLVPCRKLFQFVDDLLAQTYALVIGMDCYITKIRAVDAVGQCAPYADQFLIIKYKALISAI